MLYIVPDIYVHVHIFLFYICVKIFGGAFNLPASTYLIVLMQRYKALIETTLTSGDVFITNTLGSNFGIRERRGGSNSVVRDSRSPLESGFPNAHSLGAGETAFWTRRPPPLLACVVLVVLVSREAV